MTRVAIATCRNLPEPDPDQELLVAALEKAGARPTLLAWDEPSARFSDHDLTVLRSTWNYFEHVEDFLRWTEGVPRLFNPPRIVRTNANKTYLRALHERGVDVVPTEFVEKGERRAVAEILDARGWDRIVIKPTVSAGSFRTASFDRTTTTEAQAFLDGLAADRAAMVQRWMPAVETYGERSLVWIDGEVSHAIRKSPRFSGGHESVSDEVPIAPEERAFAEKAVAPVAKELLYARVDMIRDDDGVLRIMELELIEPSLFFKQAPRALDRFVAGILARAKGKD